MDSVPAECCRQLTVIREVVRLRVESGKKNNPFLKTYTITIFSSGFNIFKEYGTGDSDWDNATYDLASTFIYDGNQESLPFTLSGNLIITDTNKLPTFHIWATSPYSERLTGATYR
jgi:hypothetical protein